MDYPQFLTPEYPPPYGHIAVMKYPSLSQSLSGRGKDAYFGK